MTISSIESSASRPKIHWEEKTTSAANEPVVFIHALGSNLHLWDELLPQLPNSLRCIRYDLRGHGLSEEGASECTIEDHVEDLIRLLNDCDIEAASLVGVSVGGMIAMATAITHPLRVRRAVMCATAGRVGTTESWNERIAQVKREGLEAMAAGILGRWFTSGFAERQPEIYQRTRAGFVNTSASGYMATCAALRDADFRPRLSQLRQRALVLAGEHDVVSSPAVVHELAAALPNARMEIISDAAHLPLIEQPTVFAEAMRRFWKDNP